MRKRRSEVFRYHFMVCRIYKNISYIEFRVGKTLFWIEKKIW